jgi:hypothetical protein
VLSPRRGPRHSRDPRPWLAALVLALFALPAGAQTAPPNYVTVLGGTTVAYQPHGGSWDGWQHDLSLTVGYGRYFTKTLAFELDLGPTWVSGDYASFSFVPALVWSFDPHVYFAARFIVPIDPETNFALFPGIGLFHAFSSGVAPYLEVNAISFVGRGNPDLGIGVTLGISFAF